MIPRARGLPLLGSSVPLLRNPLAFLRSAHEREGPVFEVRAATRRFVVLAGREANRFLGREGRQVLGAEGFWGRLAEYRRCPHAILAVDGPEHRTQRKHYGDVLSRRLVDEHREGCDALVRRTFGRDPSRPSLRSQTRLLVARLVHHCLAQGAAPIDEDTAWSLMEAFRWESNALLLGKWPRLALRMPAYRRHLRRAERFIDELERAQAEASDDGLVGWFQRVRRGRAEHPELFTPGDVRFALLMPFVAGVDTVGATLGFVLYELHRDRDLRSAVEQEVREAYAEGVPEATTLASLPALNGLVLECLRLYPAAFAVYRQAVESFEHGGARIERGTDVVVFTSATHFDARYFPEPDRIDVDRHGSSRRESRAKHVFMPYGGGPHVCLGAGMGEALLRLATAAIVRHHDFEPLGEAGPPPITFDPSLTLGEEVVLRRAPARS